MDGKDMPVEISLTVAIENVLLYTVDDIEGRIIKRWNWN